MAVAVETTEIIEPWLYTTLSTDATLAGLVGDRIFGTIVDDEVASPYVVFALNSPRDVNGIGTTRVMTDNLYIVKGVALTTSWDDLIPIARRIDQLLQGNTGTTAAGNVIGVNRQMTIQYVDPASGEQWRHLGGLFRVWAHSS